MTTPADDGVLRDLAPRPPAQLLEELARVAKLLASAGRPRPDVELGLASGQVVKGKLVRVEGGTALVHTGGHARAPSVAYVRVEHIVVLTLPDASVLVHEPVLAAELPVPSRLELARKVAGLLPPIGFAEDLDDGARRAVGALVPLLTAILSELAHDPMGREALAQLEAIELSSGVTARVLREGKRLAIHAPVLAAEAFTLESLRAAIEKSL